MAARSRCGPATRPATTASGSTAASGRPACATSSSSRPVCWSTAAPGGSRPTGSTPAPCCGPSWPTRAATGACGASCGFPTPEQEEAKRLHRERRRLVRERVAHTNRIRGLLASQGIFDLHPLRTGCRERLDALVTGDGRPLGAALRRDILREFERLELVVSQLAAVEAERDAVAAGDAIIGRLMALRGIGPETATVLAREVFYREFANRRQVGGYAGLAPSPFASGDRSRDQGISKAGNALVRTTMVELAWLWVRYQPDSRLARWFVARAQGAAGRIRRIAIVALARKLLVSLWRYLTQDLVPDGAALKAA